MADSTVNDAGIAIQAVYDARVSIDHPALSAWRRSITKRGAPFRPDFKMYVGHGSPEMTAERLQLLQTLGAESFILAWDLPSQLGFDPDHRLSRSQVGRAGVSCSSLDDMREICSRLDLTRLKSFGTLANSLGHIGFAMISETLKDAGASSTPIFLQNDPLKEFTARGTEIFSPQDALRIACDVAEYMISNEIPGHAITVCSNHYDIAGAGPTLALGIALANGVAYMDELVRRGVEVDRAARSISFFVNERSDFFITAAVFRTTRTLWADVLRTRYGFDQSLDEPLHLMGYAHGLETADEPMANVARVAVSVTAATFGGADTLCAASYDEALRIPSDDAAALALRTIQIASSEHGASETVDPLRGSYKYESLCKSVSDEAQQVFEAMMTNGGAIACIDNGYVLSRLSERQSYRHERLKEGSRPWFGVNVNRRPELHYLFEGKSQVDARLREIEMHLADVSRVRKADAHNSTDRALADVERDASEGNNLVSATIVALRSGATTEQLITSTRRGLESNVRQVR